MHQPPSGQIVRRVTYSTEWRPASLEADDKIYAAYEGIVNGVRNFDDDGDGRVDEDPLDGRDNDGDNKIDEDYDQDSDTYSVCSTDPAVFDCDDAVATTNPGAPEPTWQPVQATRACGPPRCAIASGSIGVWQTLPQKPTESTYSTPLAVARARITTLTTVSTAIAPSVCRAGRRFRS